MSLSKSKIAIHDILRGDKKAIAEALNLLENTRPDQFERSYELIERIICNARPTRHIIGITGPPGVGKSTLISRIIREYRKISKSVGII